MRLCLGIVLFTTGISEGCSRAVSRAVNPLVRPVGQLGVPLVDPVGLVGQVGLPLHWAEALRVPCASNPCQNGGTCHRAETENVTTAHCACPIDFTGQWCENHTNLCGIYGDMCKNGGTCYVPTRMSSFRLQPEARGCSSVPLMVNEEVDSCVRDGNATLCQCSTPRCNNGTQAIPEPKPKQKIPCCLNEPCNLRAEGEFCYMLESQEALPQLKTAVKTPLNRRFGSGSGYVGILDFSQWEGNFSLDEATVAFLRQTLSIDTLEGSTRTFCSQATIYTNRSLVPTLPLTSLIRNISVCYCGPKQEPTLFEGEEWPCNHDLDTLMTATQEQWSAHKDMVRCQTGGPHIHSLGHYCSSLWVDVELPGDPVTFRHPLQQSAIRVSDPALVKKEVLGCVNLTTGDLSLKFCLCKDDDCNSDIPPPKPINGFDTSTITIVEAVRTETSPFPVVNKPFSNPNIPTLSSTTSTPSSSHPTAKTMRTFAPPHITAAYPAKEEADVAVGVALLAMLVLLLACTGAVYWYKRYNKMRRLNIETIVSEFSGNGGSDMVEFPFDSQPSTPTSLCVEKLPERKKSAWLLDDMAGVVEEAEDDGWELDPAQLTVFHDRVLGAGAFGTVYFGRLRSSDTPTGLIDGDWESEGTGRPVAVKTLPAPTGAHAAAVADFLREIALLRRLGHHEHLVNPIGALTRSEPLCLVSEYCSDRDLLRWLRSKRPPSQHRPVSSKADSFTKRLLHSVMLASPGALNSSFATNKIEPAYKPDPELTAGKLVGLGWQVCEGLEFVAERGFVHRDVAARNVMLHEGRLAKLGDFGLARYVYNNPAYMGHGGKLPLKWMSIEAIRDTEFTIASDVWALGVLLWELFTLGASPYPTLQPRELQGYLESGRRLPLPTCTQAGIACPAEIYSLLLWCWDEDPKRRPTFSQIKEHLSSYMEELQRKESYVSLERTE